MLNRAIVIAIHRRKNDYFKKIKGTDESYKGCKILHWDQQEDKPFDNKDTLLELKDHLETFS